MTFKRIFCSSHSVDDVASKLRSALWPLSMIILLAGAASLIWLERMEPTFANRQKIVLLQASQKASVTLPLDYAYQPQILHAKWAQGMEPGRSVTLLLSYSREEGRRATVIARPQDQRDLPQRESIVVEIPTPEKNPAEVLKITWQGPEIPGGIIELSYTALDPYRFYRSVAWTFVVLSALGLAAPLLQPSLQPRLSLEHRPAYDY